MKERRPGARVQVYEMGRVDNQRSDDAPGSPARALYLTLNLYPFPFRPPLFMRVFVPACVAEYLSGSNGR